MKKDSLLTEQALATRSAQTRGRSLVASLFCALVSLMLVAASIGAARTSAADPGSLMAQETMSGEWTAEFRREKATDKINFSFHRNSRDGRMSMSGSDFAPEDFQGLTREQVFAATSTRVNFRLVREAGTIECEGVFSNGKGAGTWRLLPSQSFRSVMGGRGYTDLSEQQMLTATILNLTAKFVDDLKTAGFDRLSFEDVIKAVIFKVTPEFVAEMKGLGYDHLGLEDLVKARIFKVDAELVRQAQAMGLQGRSLEQLVKLRIFKVTPDYLQELKDEGVVVDSIEDAVKLRIFKVDSEFIRSARASGHTDLSVEALVRLRIHERSR